MVCSAIYLNPTAKASGHIETTASAITTTLGYLAIYREEQEVVAAEILAATNASGQLVCNT
jgi:hypothetical protein